MEIKQIPIGNIVQKENVRVRIKEKSFAELMSSIKENGLLQPIGLVQENKEYIVIYGNRRLEACKKLGWTKIPAVIHSDLEEVDKIIINIVENAQRRDNTLVEVGRVINILYANYNLSLDEISIRIGLPIHQIRSAFNIYTNLPKEIIEQGQVMNMSNSKAKKKEYVSSYVLTTLASLKSELNLKDDAIQEILN